MNIKAILIIVFIILVSLLALSNALHLYDEGNITLEEHDHEDSEHEHIEEYNHVENTNHTIIEEDETHKHADNSHDVGNAST